MVTLAPTHDDVVGLADELDVARRDRVPLARLTDRFAWLDVAAGYQVQDVLRHRAVDRGEVQVGWKLGLTSRAKQRQVGVEEPIRGYLTAEMVLDPAGTIPYERLIQPRAEPEFAFLLGRDLAGRGTTAAHVVAATEAVLPAIEVLDSRFSSYSFALPDVIADNTSAAYLLVGAEGYPLADLARTGVTFEHRGQVVATATGAAVLGHPANAVAWLVRELDRSDSGLLAGQLILSGGLTEAVPLDPGDVVRARFAGLGDLDLTCSS